jgi:hypothetical protein
MTEFLILAVASAAGLLLGAVFFGGLWWTVRFIIARYCVIRLTRTPVEHFCGAAKEAPNAT